MTLLFLCTGFLVEKEIQNALAALGGQGIVKLRVPQFPEGNALEQTLEILQSRKPDLVLTVNANGLDRSGRIVAFLNQLGIALVNWYVDNPLYQELYGYRQIPAGPRVVDFVSDRSYVEPMRAKGKPARFLPLAFDPEMFNPLKGQAVAQRHDVVFVGNSTLEKMAELIQAKEEELLSRFADLMAECRRLYSRNQTLNIPAWLQKPPQRGRWWNNVEDRDKFTFLVEWFVGFQHRKDLIMHLDRQQEFSFQCFGDADWNQILRFDSSRMSVGYYTNLCETYHSARINLNITRSQIRDGFTQRIFDCLGSRCFLLTDKRPCNADYFKTSGPDQELVEFSGLADAIAKIRHFLAHPEEREAIAGRGYEKVSTRHTYLHRVREILEAIS